MRTWGFIVLIFLCQGTKVFSQEAIFTHQLPSTNFKNSSVRSSNSVDQSKLYVFNVFHENYSLVRTVFKDKVLQKKIVLPIKTAAKEESFSEFIPDEDFFSLRDNTLYTHIKDNQLIEYYVQHENNDIYLMQSDLATDLMQKKRITKLNKKERIICSKMINEKLFILVYATNKNYIRTITIEKDVLLADTTIDIDASKFKTRNDKNWFAGKSLGHTLEETFVIDEQNKPTLFMYETEADFKAYLKDSVLVFTMDRANSSDFFYFNYVNNSIQYKSINTPLTIPSNLLFFAKKSNHLVNDFYTNTFTINDGDNKLIQMDIYSVEGGQLLDKIRIAKSDFANDSILYNEWKKGVKVKSTSYSFNDKFKQLVNKNLVVKTEQRDSLIYFDMGTYKVLTPAWKVFLSIAASAAGTILINSIPNTFGYFALIYYGSQNVDEYNFSLKYNIYTKKLESANNERNQHSKQDLILNLLKKENASVGQYGSVENENTLMIGLINAKEKQFKVFSIN